MLIISNVPNRRIKNSAIMHFNTASRHTGDAVIFPRAPTRSATSDDDVIRSENGSADSWLQKYVYGRCCPCWTVYSWMLYNVLLAVVIGVACIVFIQQGGREAATYFDHRNFSASNGISIDKFCGNFQKEIGALALYSNLLPGCLTMLLILGTMVFVACSLCLRGRSVMSTSDYWVIGDLVHVLFAIFWAWAFIVKGVEAANTFLTDQSCWDFWSSQGLSVYQDLMKQEQGLFIWCAVTNGLFYLALSLIWLLHSCIGQCRRT